MQPFAPPSSHATLTDLLLLPSLTPAEIADFHPSTIPQCTRMADLLPGARLHHHIPNQTRSGPIHYLPINLRHHLGNAKFPWRPT